MTLSVEERTQELAFANSMASNFSNDPTINDLTYLRIQFIYDSITPLFHFDNHYKIDPLALKQWIQFIGKTAVPFLKNYPKKTQEVAQDTFTLMKSFWEKVKLNLINQNTEEWMESCLTLTTYFPLESFIGEDIHNTLASACNKHPSSSSSQPTASASSSTITPKEKELEPSMAQKPRYLQYLPKHTTNEEIFAELEQSLSQRPCYLPFLPKQRTPTPEKTNQQPQKGPWLYYKAKVISFILRGLHS
ncbi:MAG: hypothetical protein WCP39_03585 [Chlamydiota bacterium]